MRAWSFLALEEASRQHGGNAGYDDVPEEYYTWDSTVPNHGGPAVDDVCALRDSMGVLGISRIEDLRTISDVPKTRRRCPNCRSTAIKARTSRVPRYRCGPCRAEFEEPVEEQLTVTEYRAEYGAEWIALDGAVTAGALEAATVSRAQQHAIRELRIDALRSALLSQHVEPDETWWTRRCGLANTPIRAGRSPGTAWRRVGQDVFRRRLLERFGAMCLVTGSQPVEVLHAAHVHPFAETQRHDLSAGLLLRSDLHSLFDAGLLAITPELRVVIDRSLTGYPDLWQYNGAMLLVGNDDPLAPALRAHLAARADAGYAPPAGQLSDGRSASRRSSPRTRSRMASASRSSVPTRPK